jgi:hypothetical protein
LEHKKSQDPVREVRKDVGEVLVRMREWGEVGDHRNRRRQPPGSASSREEIQAAWRLSRCGVWGELERRVRGIYRRKGAGFDVLNQWELRGERNHWER